MPGYPGEDLEAALMEVRDSEARLRTTQVGVHRDDLALTIHGRPAGAFASEGQQRTLCLALKLAQARVLEEAQGEPPLLLIDDIFGELDKTRRQASWLTCRRTAKKSSPPPSQIGPVRLA
ncbi:hypothetical protein [Verrucomicrobium spinosum]|uniref:hypothetical protein n=1 Tax=Verrucomicrobium spinosum TaxID=2736 RepID=UPI0009466834|nr:hypothetical protein [Verrucomicrobium spinosum]